MEHHGGFFLGHVNGRRWREQRLVHPVLEFAGGSDQLVLGVDAFIGRCALGKVCILVALCQPLEHPRHRGAHATQHLVGINDGRVKRRRLEGFVLFLFFEQTVHVQLKTCRRSLLFFLAGGVGRSGEGRAFVPGRGGINDR